MNPTDKTRSESELGSDALFDVSLNDAERERLAMLAEECGEIVQIVGKILRHGYASTHPDGGPENRELLEREVGDVKAVIAWMMNKNDLNRERVGVHSTAKTCKIPRWTHFQSNVQADPHRDPKEETDE